eukprot:1389976-Amphidinium_carterae.1
MPWNALESYLTILCYQILPDNICNPFVSIAINPLKPTNVRHAQLLTVDAASAAFQPTEIKDNSPKVSRMWPCAKRQLIELSKKKTNTFFMELSQGLHKIVGSWTSNHHRWVAPGSHRRWVSFE